MRVYIYTSSVHQERQQINFTQIVHHFILELQMFLQLVLECHLFQLQEDSGTTQSITNGNTLTIAGGTGLDSVASATDTITLNIDSTVATLSGTQTLTNKSLTAPTLTGSSNRSRFNYFQRGYRQRNQCSHTYWSCINSGYYSNTSIICRNFSTYKI